MTITTVDGFGVAVRLARLGLASSAEASRCWRSVRRVAAAYDTAVVLVVLPEQVVVQEDQERPRSVVVRSAPGIFRLDQVAALKRVLGEIEGGLSASDACRRLDEILAQRPRWPWWLRGTLVAGACSGRSPISSTPRRRHHRDSSSFSAASSC